MSTNKPIYSGIYGLKVATCDVHLSGTGVNLVAWKAYSTDGQVVVSGTTPGTGSVTFSHPMAQVFDWGVQLAQSGSVKRYTAHKGPYTLGDTPAFSFHVTDFFASGTVGQPGYLANPSGSSDVMVSLRVFYRDTDSTKGT